MGEWVSVAHGIYRVCNVNALSACFPVNPPPLPHLSFAWRIEKPAHL